MNIGQLGNLGQLGANGAKGLWTPSVLGSALQFWVDANDTSSVALSGSNVTQWNDLSTNARNLTQAVALEQPTYITDGAGRQGVAMDGVNDSMSSPAFSISQPFSRFLVVTRRDSLLVGTIINSLAGTPNSNMANSSATRVLMFSGTASIVSNQNTINTQVSQFGLEYNGASSALWNNGTSTTGTNPGTNGMNGVRIGGGTPSAYVYHSVIVTNAILTTDQRQRVEGYLAHRYNIQSSLPSGHPFRDLPPTI
jgi:hypothetical protein